MSTVVPKRRIYDGDTVNPEDFNETVDDVNRELANLNEHNLSAAGFRTQVALSDLDNSVAWRIKARLQHRSQFYHDCKLRSRGRLRERRGRAVSI